MLSVTHGRRRNRPTVTAGVRRRDDSSLGEPESIDVLLGPVDVGVADGPIAGVDAVIRLGTDYLDLPVDGGRTVTDRCSTDADRPDGAPTTTVRHDRRADRVDGA